MIDSLLIFLLTYTSTHVAIDTSNNSGIPCVFDRDQEILQMTKAEILTESEAPGKTEELSNPGRGKFLNLDSAILPEHYKIHLDFEFSTLNYYGTVELEGSLRYSPGSPQSLLTKRLQLHSRHNYITSIKVRHGAAVYQARAEQIEPDLIELIDEATNSRDFELLPANGTKVALEYRFLGQITDDFDGIYRNMIVNEKEGTVAGQNYYATTQCEPTGCMAIFPSIDAPSAKATFELSLTVDERIVAVSNMELNRKTHIEGSKKMLYEFRPTPKMSTYLFSLFLSDFVSYETKSSRGVDMHVYTRPHLLEYSKFALGVLPKMLDYFEEYYEIDYVLNKLDSVVIDKFESSAMENWGMMSFRKSAFLVSPDTSLEDKRLIAQIIAHEVAHQWFGNLVTMTWWDDLWLNEGFATFLMYRCAQKITPELSPEDQFLQNRLFSGHILDSLHNSHAISADIKETSQIREIFDQISYNKSASWLRMINAYIDDENFKAGVTRYLNTYKYSNADYVQFIEAIQQEVPDIDLVGISEKWLLDKNSPIVTVSRSVDGNTLNLRQTRFVSLDLKGKVNDPNDVWKIPMVVKRIRKDRSVVVEKILMDQYEMQLQIDTDELLLLNSNTNGFYLAVYDNELQKLIGEYAESISDLDFFSIVLSMGLTTLSNTAEADKVASKINFNAFMDLITSSFDNMGESSYTVLIKILTSIKSLFSEMPLIDDAIQKFASNQCFSLFKQLEKKVELTSAEKGLVTFLLQFMVDNDVEEVISHFNSQFKSLESTSSDLIQLQASILLKNSKEQDCQALFDKIFHMAKEHIDETIKQKLFLSLPYASSPAVRRNLYEMLFDGRINPMDSRSIAPTIGHSSSRSSEFAKYMLEGDTITKFTESYTAMIGSRFLLNAFRSLKDVELATKLKSSLDAKSYSAPRAVSQMMETVMINHKLVENYSLT